MAYICSVKNSSGTAFATTNNVLNSSGTSFAISSIVLNSSGTMFTVCTFVKTNFLNAGGESRDEEPFVTPAMKEDKLIFMIVREYLKHNL